MKALCLLLLLLPGSAALACTVCRPRVEAGIHNADYAANLALLLLPVGLLLGLGLGLFYWDKLTSSSRLPHAPHP
ncbi:hypothetical protein GCM10023185_25970 [Hymenobacter saemangeumensis]|uniref:Uncharacterized protein n=1 Tax=Hymenobacter saemangeumensis TaxID=1084522 RepID=A0ABP8II70_9BACT